MEKRKKASTCRFRSRRRERVSSERGMVLICVMIVATLLLIALTATLPSVYQEGRREQEAELIFRGTQYARAVALFHQHFNRYPTSIKELLQTDGIRFLRQEYRDPMDPKGKWRFIHVNAAGVLLDSKNQALGNNCGNPAGIGQTGSTNSTFGGNSSMGSSSMGFSSMGNSSFGGASPGGLPAGCSSSTGSLGTGSTATTSASSDSTSLTSQAPGGSMMGGSSAFGNSSSQIGPTSSFFSNSNGVQGAFIAGVAAPTSHESIRIWQKHHHYDEWEFIGLDMGIFGTSVGLPATASSPTGMGQQPSQQGSSFSLGSSPASPSGASPGSFGSPGPSTTIPGSTIN
jgi:hypothetical protein